MGRAAEQGGSQRWPGSADDLLAGDLLGDLSMLDDLSPFITRVNYFKMAHRSVCRTQR
jgi:hypothetical protein